MHVCSLLIPLIDANGNTTSYAYDSVGRLVKTTNALGAEASVTYDATGKVLSSTSFGGITTTYAYDANGRLTSKTTGSTVVSYTYTQDGRLLTMTDEQGVTEYAYGAMNGLARVSYPDGTYVAYTYDSSNLLISLQTPFGETRYTYDALHRIATVTDKDGAETRYTYDANGNRSSMTYANGVTTLYTYDSCNHLISQTIKDTNGTILENYEITLGAAGERLQIVEKNRTVNYTYDTLYRLTRETVSANGVSSSTTYTYDAMSNRLSKETTSGTTTYTYNELNQLTASSDATYTYDADGNQIAVQEAARAVTYHYNDLGRMSGAVVQSLGQTTLETYSYNGNGIRIAKNTDGIETRYLIDPNGSLSYVLAEYDADENVTAYYTRGTELISRETSGEIRYYQYDPNGSVRLLTDASGDVSDTYTFDAFGSLIFQTGTSGNSFLFQGEQYDSATGLYYLRARYMNPATGTFTTMDAYQGSTSDPMSLHKYLFANANPVMYSDPSGYFTLLETELSICLASEINAFIATEIFANDYFSQHGYGTGEEFDYGEYLGGAGLTFLRSFAHGLVAMVCVAAISIFALTILEMVMCSIILAIVGLIAGDVANTLELLGNPEVAEALRIVSELSYTGSATFALEAIFAWLFGPVNGGSSNSLTSKSGETSVAGFKTTADYVSDILKIDGQYYAPKDVIDKIGIIEARGINFSDFAKKALSTRTSTEGGFSTVYSYSDSSGVRFVIHEVTDAAGNILHRDFDAVRIASGQIINKL